MELTKLDKVLNFIDEQHLNEEEIRLLIANLKTGDFTWKVLREPKQDKHQ